MGADRERRQGRVRQLRQRGRADAFLTGLAQLHNFEYGDAAQWFRKAEDADPSFALAYWGEAMTYNHPVWMQQDIASARKALKRLADTADERQAKAPTAREKAYMRAVDILYGDGDKYARDAAYAREMAALHSAYPDDVDGTAFYALSLLGTAHEGRNVETYMRAAALLEPLFITNPQHPGIAHYLIHSTTIQNTRRTACRRRAPTRRLRRRQGTRSTCARTFSSRWACGTTWSERTRRRWVS